MNILLINVPSRKGIGGFMLPLGLLYVGTIIERCGHKAKILDPYLDDFELKGLEQGDLKRIDKLIEDYKPSIVGYGGIATSYGRAKRLSLYIGRKYPEITQIAGGPLASVYELLLTKARVDAVFHGEAEVSLPIFLDKIGQKALLHNTPGISYLLNEKVVRNDPPEQIKDLDTIPFPGYHLVDAPKYLHSIKDWLEHYQIYAKPYYHGLSKKIGTRRHYIPIITSRGCTHRCSFCYRHVRGFRQHSVSYVISHIKYLKETYGVKGFQFCDELFNARPEWVMELCDAIEQEGLNIFYLVGGARVSKVDEKMLRRLKDTGCISIEYGQESGSDTILKEYGKGVTSQENKEITLLTKKVGIFSCAQLVIGSPSETTKTIYETIKFLADAEVNEYNPNYLIPLPGTPIWQYVEEKKLVRNVERYLDLVAEHGGKPLINLTKEPDRVWKKWAMLIRVELKLSRYKKKSRKLYHFYKFPYKFLYLVVLPLVPHWMMKLIPQWMRRLELRV